jgi:hypothetical protein
VEEAQLQSNPREKILAHFLGLASVQELGFDIQRIVFINVVLIEFHMHIDVLEFFLSMHGNTMFDNVGGIGHCEWLFQDFARVGPYIASGSLSSWFALRGLASRHFPVHMSAD